VSGYGGCVMGEGMSVTHNCIADSKAQRIHMQLVPIVRVCVNSHDTPTPCRETLIVRALSCTQAQCPHDYQVS